MAPEDNTMLIKFSVGNFLSFKDIQTLDMTPDALKELPGHLHIPYLFDPKARLLKSMAIYGHNSHGKSNFIKAYQFFSNFIFSSFSFSRIEELINVDRFKLNTAFYDKPTHFEITFYLRETKYRYGFKITSKKVIEEWLFYSEPKVRENYLFIRSEDEIKISKIWNKEADNRVEQANLFTKSHHLLLSVLIAQENLPRVSEIDKWLRGNIVITQLTTTEQINRAVLIFSQLEFRDLITKFIDKADLGFKTIIEKIDSHLNKKISLEKEFIELWYDRELKDFELYTQHDTFNEAYKKEGTVLFEMLKSESSGSIKFFIFSCLLSYSIKKGQLILIDEIDSQFHSTLLLFLILTFNDPKLNVLGSQLIYTSHNTVLLDNKTLRRDQIVFIEKNNYGESSLRKMHTSKTPIRMDTLIEKEYLKGGLGGMSPKLKKGGGNYQLDFE